MVTCQVNTLVDFTRNGAVNDGDIQFEEYATISQGVGEGFGDVIGMSSILYFNSDTLGNLFIALQSGVGRLSLTDVAVIYIDSKTGGFNTTASFNDYIDLHRAAISGNAFNDGASADLIFPNGFTADYAITFDLGYAALWELSTSSHFLIKSLLQNPTLDDNTLIWEFSGWDMDDISSREGGCFRFLATYINPSNAFRSNEFHGLEVAPGSNIGTASFDMGVGQFNIFQSYNVDFIGDKTWIGLSTDWKDNANWTLCSVPAMEDHVWIGPAPNGAVVNLGSSIIVNLLTIRAGATFEVEVGSSLEVKAD